MNSSAAEQGYPEESLRYPGWRVVVICQIGVLTGIATIFFSIFTLFLKPWQVEFGWSREQIAQAFSTAAITVASCSPLMGRVLDRFEPRKVIAAMMVAFGLGFASLAWLTPSTGHLYSTAVFLGVTGTGTYQLGYARIVASWFQRRLGTALSVVVAGSGVGSLFFPPLVQHCITVYGWRSTTLLLAALPVLLGAPLTFLFAPSAGRSSAPRDERKDAAPGLGWRQALAGRSFWLLALGVCAMSLAENGITVHLAPMLSDRGLAASHAALVVSFLGGASVGGRLLLGWVLDYLEGSYLAMGSLLLAGAGLFLLGHAHSFPAAIGAAVLAGLGMGCEFDLMPYILKRYFGIRSFSTMYGLLYTGYATAGAIAPLVMGRIYDATGSYTVIVSIFSGCTAVAGLCMLALPAYTNAEEIAVGAESREPSAKVADARDDADPEYVG